MKLFQVTIAAGKDVKDVEANAAGSEQDKDAKNKKVIFDLEKNDYYFGFQPKTYTRERNPKSVLNR
jgi:hypothetical protein